VSVTLNFNGIGIDVFCILANQVQGADTTTELVFTLDDSPQPLFTHNPDSSSSYLYHPDGKVFSVSGLTQGGHQLVVETNNPSGSLLLFDYAEYSYEVPDPTTATIAQVTNTVIETSIAQVTTTDTDTQKIPSAQTSNTGPLSNTNASPSSHSGSATTLPASSPKDPSSTIPTSSATLGSSPTSAPPAISSGTSSSSSLAPPVVASSKKFNYVPVLAGTLIPVLLVVVIGVLCWRRRARRANIPDTESRNGSRREWSSSVSPFDGNSATRAADIQTREKYDSGPSNYVSPSPIQNNDPPASPPAPSEYTFETSPPPMYSEQRPLPSVPPIPTSFLSPNQA